MFRLLLSQVGSKSALRLRSLLIAFLIACISLVANAQTPGDDEHAAKKSNAEDVFSGKVTRFIKSYCIECHQNSRPTEAGVNFSPALKSPQHAAFTQQWKRAAARVKAHDMPPEGLDQPTDEERQVFLDWVENVKYLSPKDPGPFVIRRLTKAEYGNTLRDLFGVSPEIAASLPDEVSGAGYMNSLSPLQLEQYLVIAEKVLDQTWRDNELLVDLLSRWGVRGAEDLIAGDPASVRTVASKLAGKIYRRPASEEELDVLVGVFDLGRENELGTASALRLMVKAMIVSPQFLFITPAEQPDSDAKIIPLDDYQLASRLSYFLWASMPDEELFTLAAAGKLHEPEVLRAQVQRMIGAPRSSALFDGFGAQWLGLDDWNQRVFDPDKFPQMNDSLRAAMYDEAKLVFETVLRDNRSIAAFINSDFTFMNAELAAIYGLSDSITGAKMRKVTLKNRNRGGLLGMPAVLAATSFPDRTSPVNRGVWVLEQVLGEHVPAAPPDVPALETPEQESGEGLTLRERTEMHRSDPVCANCHRLLDPIGFGLENFDAIGRWREWDDNGKLIDSVGKLPDGNQFSTPEELKAMIAVRLEDFSSNLTEKLLAYSVCRQLEGYDAIVVDNIARRVADDGHRMQTLVTEIVLSYPFTHRRVKGER